MINISLDYSVELNGGNDEIYYCLIHFFNGTTKKLVARWDAVEGLDIEDDFLFSFLNGNLLQDIFDQCSALYNDKISDEYLEKDLESELE